MTAEIVIMNKSAIAIAADSAVTIGENKKIYNTVNKIFALSKLKPVGIMVFNNSEFMGVPWETVIKAYRKELGNRGFKTLKEYYDDFIRFIKENRLLFPEDIQKDFFRIYVNTIFSQIRDTISNKAKEEIEKRGKIKDTEIARIVEEAISQCYDYYDKLPYLQDFSEEHIKKNTKDYGDIIKEMKDAIFEKLPISDSLNTKLEYLCSFPILKNLFFKEFSGIVIVGFGDDEKFPSVFSLKIETIINNIVKYAHHKSQAINFLANASIMPFAQDEMVVTFIEGINPALMHALDSYFSKLLTEYPKMLIEEIGSLSESEKRDLSGKLGGISKKVLDKLRSTMLQYRRDNFIIPIVNTVAFLPKEELAIMAETLVNLTLFKKKVSMEPETVGGPIDVAIISKGDGFVWIKRKHYFKCPSH